MHDVFEVGTPVCAQLTTADLTPSRIILVPHWILRALQRNNLNYIDLLDYAAVHTTLSVADQIDFLYANMYLGSQFDCPEDNADGYILNQWRASTLFKTHPAIQTQIEQVVAGLNALPVPVRPSVDAALTERTTDPIVATHDTPLDQPTYEITLGADRNCYVQLHRGFLKPTAPAHTQTFLVTLLKTLYRVQSVDWVATHCRVFLRYVTAL